MTEGKHIRIEDLEKLLTDDDRLIEIHADGTVTVEERMGPPKPMFLGRVADNSTY